ncbi:MmpS family transport accessory protein [Nocardia carnea]|uniref:MmpS family transport accessory protein n=1 Tax=Nocardia carnea TaxID=37328 RepID=UPI0024553035|nr:MmpS family transport accessory protein [Nocardia carnea]
MTYEVTGDADATVLSYVDAKGQAQQILNAEVPWSLTFQAYSSVVLAHVSVITKGNEAGCRITVNGEVKDEKTATGQYSAARCAAGPRHRSVRRRPRARPISRTNWFPT